MYSRARTALPAAYYALADLLTGRTAAGGQAGAIEAGRAWLARRLGASPAALARAQTTLTRAGYLTSTRRGCGLTAQRAPAGAGAGRGDGPAGYVDALAWTLGDDRRGCLVDGRDWVGYLAALDQARQSRSGWCALGARRMAALLHRDPDEIGPMYRRLAAAGLVVLVSSRGRPDVVLPLVQEHTAEQRATLTAALAEACGYQSSQASGVPRSDASGVPRSDASGVPRSDASYRGDTLSETPIGRHNPSPAPVGAAGTSVPREAAASAAAPRTGKIHTQPKGTPTPARPARDGAAPAAALAVLARLPRPWRDCPPWVRRRLADTLGRALARYGPDAIVTAVARYAPDPATAALAGGLHTATTGPDAVRHLPALAAALALLAADVKGGACPACAGEHPGRRCDPASGTGPPPAEPVDQADVAGPAAWWAAADPDRCEACQQPGGQVRAELPLASPVCDPCWAAFAPAAAA